MKKYLLNIMTIIMVAVMSAGFVSCSDDEDEVGIPLESLYGTWNISEIKVLESTPYYPREFAKTSATFNSDGTYQGKGVYGNGSGTYTVNGNTITTYVDDEVYIVYTLISLKDDVAELKLDTGETVLWIKCVKENK